MTECKHGLITGTCHICRHDRSIYWTAGGTAYHRTRDCEHLLDGQELVVRRGGVTAPIEVTTESDAIAAGRRPCRNCRP